MALSPYPYSFLIKELLSICLLLLSCPTQGTLSSDSSTSFTLSLLASLIRMGPREEHVFPSLVAYHLALKLLCMLPIS